MTDKLIATPEEVARQEKMLLALELREGGAKYREIAKSLGISVGTAYTYINNALEELHERVIETADRMRALENNRLDAMWRDLSTRKDAAGLLVIDRKLKIMERRARLNALDLQPDMAVLGAGPGNASVDARETVRAKVTAIEIRIKGGAQFAEAVTATVIELEATASINAAPQNGNQNGTQNGTNGDQHAHHP